MNLSTKRGFELIERRKNSWVNEEEVRHVWMRGLEEAIGIDLDAERARRDSSYNNVVIEFKAPGLFNASENSPAFVEAVNDRLFKYISRLSQSESLDEEDYIGIAIDGAHIAFAQMQGGQIVHQPLMPFSAIAFQMVVDALEANFRRAITAENLAEDFGHLSSIGRIVMQELSTALSVSLGDPGNRKIKMLFEEWVTLYGQAADLSSQQKKKIDRSLGFTFAGRAEIDLSAKLFVTHTFHSFLMKLLAAEIVAAHGLASSQSLIHELLALDEDKRVFESLKRDIENGGFYNAVGLHGFVEEAIFSWYLDFGLSASESASLCEAIRTLLARLSVYRFDSIKKSARSRDVLRDFYQDLVPEELRKSLGEFYTPDWLVEHAVAKLNYDDEAWLGSRVLDPTCGSGSFLLEAIEKKRGAAARAGWSDQKTVEMLTTTVWGFDLNPLAVQSSRVNFLIAIADLLRSCKGQDVEIPILLADAVYSPAPHPKGDPSLVEYTVGSNHADLNITLPTSLARDRELLDQVFQVMGEQVELDSEYDIVAAELVASSILTPASAHQWEEHLRATYNRVLALHRQNWNGIWFRIIRNFFWSANAGRFDAIIGNPPWVRWSNLPESYRNRAKPTCEQYAIFSDTKFHGGNEIDISAIITYTTADKWLRAGGKLVFVITQTVLQSPSSQGFRRFMLGETERLVPLNVDDMKELKPFPGAANKTAVISFEKRDGKAVTYPVEYNVWLGKPKTREDGTEKVGKSGRSQRTKSLDPRMSRSEILGQVEVIRMEANPVSSTINGAPWAVMKPGHFNAYKPLFGPSTWVNGRKGITTDLNGVYFVEVVDVNESQNLVKVRTRPGEGKTNLGLPREFWVEAASLYPLAKGAGDIQPCRFEPQGTLFTFVPNNGIDRQSLVEASLRYNAQVNPKTYKFFAAYKIFLENRSTYKTRMKNAPYFSVYNVGEYTFAPYKVLWAEMTGSFCAAVATNANVPAFGNRVYVPDHKLYFADFEVAEPAYFLCGLLHSEVVKEMIEAHHVSTNMGDVFKHISLPRYNSSIIEHNDLAAIVLKAHQEESAGRRAKILVKIRALADKIVKDEIQARLKPPAGEPVLGDPPFHIADKLKASQNG